MSILKRFKNIIVFFIYSFKYYFLMFVKLLKIFLKFLINYFHYLSDFIRYSSLRASQGSKFRFYPRLGEDTASTDFDHHYLYQNTWAFRKIAKSQVKSHTDIGSLIDFIAILSVVTNVTFVDIRPPKIKLKNLITKKGDILHLPFKDNSIQSLSCLHVAEHIGLGRYGDKIDPLGTQKATKELQRVLAKGGYLYFSLPVGRPRVEFNAHRVHSPQQIINFFDELKLVEISGVLDNGEFVENIDVKRLTRSSYACGMFIFTKE